MGSQFTPTELGLISAALYSAAEEWTKLAGTPDVQATPRIVQALQQQAERARELQARIDDNG